MPRHPSQTSVRRLALLSALSLLLGLLLCAGCQEPPVDRLYALKLERAPQEADWQRALPRLVVVKGGRKHEPRRLDDIDADTVHTSTASCHHGASLPDPVLVDLRAFYTERDLYLRLSWSDATRDDAMQAWRYTGDGWENLGGQEDGFGLLWAPHGRPLSCAQACHIEDFGVSRASFHARNKMMLPGDGQLDLWNWKAARTAPLGFADDRYLDRSGMHGDVPGELFRPNSQAAQSGRTDLQPFAAEDRPIYDAEGQPTEQGFRPAGSRAPGYLTERPAGGRADVAAYSQYRGGRWTVVLRRALDTGDRRDVAFVPGDRAGVAFGLSLMDNSLYEHYASLTEERLVLLPSGGAGD